MSVHFWFPPWTGVYFCDFVPIAEGLHRGIDVDLAEFLEILEILEIADHAGGLNLQPVPHEGSTALHGVLQSNRGAQYLQDQWCDAQPLELVINILAASVR